jgi:hypothetical protein
MLSEGRRSHYVMMDFLLLLLLLRCLDWNRNVNCRKSRIENVVALVILVQQNWAVVIEHDDQELEFHSKIEDKSIRNQMEMNYFCSFEFTAVFSMTVISSSDKSMDPASSCDKFQSMLTFSN